MGSLRQSLMASPNYVDLLCMCRKKRGGGLSGGSEIGGSQTGFNNLKIFVQIRGLSILVGGSY